MPDHEPDCIFCKIVAGDLPSMIVAEDELTVAFLDVNLAMAGHMVVVPRRHTAGLREIGSEDLAASMEAAQRVATQLTDRLGAVGVNVLNNCGSGAWQTVFHFHLHVIPRYEDDPLRLPWVPGPGNRDEIAQTFSKLTT